MKEREDQGEREYEESRNWYRGGTQLRCAVFDEKMQIVDSFKEKNDRKQCGGYGLSIIGKEIFGRDIDAKEIFELWHQGDEKAVSLIEKTADVAAKGIANVGCVIDPDVYVVGGSVANFNPDFVDLVFHKAKQYYVNLTT